MPPLVERARDRLTDFREAVSWRDLEARLAAHGLQLERKGQGLVLTDGEQSVKASRIARDVSLRRLEERFGVAYEQRHAVPALPSEVARLARDLRVYERVDALNQAGFSAETEASAAAVRRDQLAAAIHHAERAHRAFEQGMARLYREPATAVATFRAQLATQGAATIERLRTHPEVFGPLATVDRTRFGGLWISHDDRPARAVAIGVAGLWRAVGDAEQRVLAAAMQSRARRMEVAFMGELTQAYRDAAAARMAWDRLAASCGAEQAASVIRRAPEQLGMLAADYGISIRAARFHARGAADLGAALGALRADADPTAERGAAEAATERARVRVRISQRDSAQEETPHLDQLRRSLAHQLQRLAAPELAQLTQVITAPQAALISRIRATARDLALGRDDGRER